MSALREAGLKNLSLARGHARLAGVAQRAGDSAEAEREAALAEQLFRALGEHKDPVLRALRQRRGVVAPGSNVDPIE